MEPYEQRNSYSRHTVQKKAGVGISCYNEIL